MKRYVRASSTLPEGITQMTFDEDYSISGGDLYSSEDGGNVDTGIETTDGHFFIAYSGHGVAPCSGYAEMIQHLQM